MQLLDATAVQNETKPIHAAPKTNPDSVPVDFLALLLGAGIDVQFPDEEPEPDVPTDPAQKKNDNPAQVIPAATPAPQPPVSIRLTWLASLGEANPIQRAEPGEGETPLESGETKPAQNRSVLVPTLSMPEPAGTDQTEATKNGMMPFSLTWTPWSQTPPVQNEAAREATPKTAGASTPRLWAGNQPALADMLESSGTPVPAPAPPGPSARADATELALSLKIEPIPAGASKDSETHAPTPAAPASSARADAPELALSPGREAVAVQPAAHTSDTNTGEQRRENKQFEMPATPAATKDVPPAAQHSFPAATAPELKTDQVRSPEPAAAPPAVRVPEPVLETAKTAPIRELSLQLPSAGDKAVDLHIVDDRGKLHVEVRTSDVQLASSLRDNVGDLVQKLDHSGYRTESRDQVGATGATSGSSQSGPDGGKPSTEQDRQPGGQGGHSGQPQQQGHGRGNRPRWLEEIVTNFRAAAQQENETPWQSIQ